MKNGANKVADGIRSFLVILSGLVVIVGLAQSVNWGGIRPSTFVIMIVSLLVALGLGLASTHLVHLVRRFPHAKRAIIAYPQEDIITARDILETLRAAGVRVWINFEKIGSSENYEAAFENALYDADVLVLLLSRKPTTTLLFELESTISRGIEIIPVLLEERELPREIAQTNPIRYYKNPSEGIKELSTLISAGKQTMSRRDAYLDAFGEILGNSINHISLVSAVIGIILIHVGKPVWASVLIGLSIVGLLLILMSKRSIKKYPRLVNPYLIIDRDDLLVELKQDRREVEERIIFLALRKVDTYSFKIYWTGSSPEVMVSCDPSVGELKPDKNHPYSKVVSWQVYHLVFNEPIKPYEKREVILKLTVFDKDHKAMPYHIISYAHVRQCKSLLWRVVYEDSLLPTKVCFVEFDEKEIARNRRELQSRDMNEYFVSVYPVQGWKYSVEWDYESRALAKARHEHPGTKKAHLLKNHS